MSASIRQALQQLAHTFIFGMFGHEQAGVFSGLLDFADIPVDCSQCPCSLKVGGVTVVDRLQQFQCRLCLTHRVQTDGINVNVPDIVRCCLSRFGEMSQATVGISIAYHRKAERVIDAGIIRVQRQSLFQFLNTFGIVATEPMQIGQVDSRSDPMRLFDKRSGKRLLSCVEIPQITEEIAEIRM